MDQVKCTFYTTIKIANIVRVVFEGGAYTSGCDKVGVEHEQ